MASLSDFVRALSLSVSVILLFNPIISSFAKPFFIFGDSLYDPGNNRYINPDPSYYRPYGTTFFNRSTGRHSDGRVVADFIAIKLNLTEFIPPFVDNNSDYTNGVSFASAGAAVEQSDNKAHNFQDQVNVFLSLKETENWSEEWLSEGVYLVCMGGNDYFPYGVSTEDLTLDQIQQLVDTVIEFYVQILQQIYEAGARKFMLQNVSPLGCLPDLKQQFGISGAGCSPKALTIATMHNVAFNKTLESLGWQNFTYSIFDYYSAISHRMSNPKQYGFASEAKEDACCGGGERRASGCGNIDKEFSVCANKTEYVFFDGGHNTDEANRQLAELMWSTDSVYVKPYSMSQLFDLTSTAQISHKKNVADA